MHKTFRSVISCYLCLTKICACFHVTIKVTIKQIAVIKVTFRIIEFRIYWVQNSASCWFYLEIKKVIFAVQFTSVRKVHFHIQGTKWATDWRKPETLRTVFFFKAIEKKLLHYEGKKGKTFKNEWKNDYFDFLLALYIRSVKSLKYLNKLNIIIVIFTFLKYYVYVHCTIPLIKL